MAQQTTNASHSTRPLGVTVMPEWFACEGVDAVLDRVQSIGATAIATSPYVLEPVAEGKGGREPPIDGGAGHVRPLDRALFGLRALWVRTEPSFEHDFERYAGLRYQPARAGALTRRQGDVLDRALENAASRNIEVLLQVMAASPPGYRVQFSGAHADDQCLGPDGATVADRVDRNASLASPHVRAYVAELCAELAERYPSVAGFRLDWPEYPPYRFRSALFDFHPDAQALMVAQGNDPRVVARDVGASVTTLRQALRTAIANGDAAVRAVFARRPWLALFESHGPLAPLFASKRDAVTGLLHAVRTRLGAVSGSRRRLEAQAFPPPFHTISGFPLDRLQGFVDAVGIKLYTMHWPMIARAWAQDLIEETSGTAVDVVTAAVAEAFDFVDGAVDGALLRYPEPHEAHPVSARAQRAKIAEASASAGGVSTIAFAHTYGPLDDVLARFAIAVSTGRPVWLNRYGYLSDAKLKALAAP
ncbi:MAG TPA: beta-galactosidase [Casimicrobiaceae bacterium]|nr:beta-galactosidase [Casimicrobiaceae bacterium]